MKRRILSFKYAFQGLSELWRSQINFRIHVIITLLVVILGTWLKISFTEWLVIIICIGMVLTIEALNTAGEYIVNFISPEYHTAAGKIKDILAAAVLITTLVSIIIGLLIFLPKIFDF